MSSTELGDSRLYAGAYGHWSDYQVVVDGSVSFAANENQGVMSWMFPGPDGPQFAFQSWHDEDCKVMTYGRNLQKTLAFNLSCFSVAVADDRTVALGGPDTRDGQNTLALHRDGAEVWRVTIPASIHARLAQPQNWGAGAEAGVPLSLYFYNGALYAMVMRGTTMPEAEPLRDPGYPTNTIPDDRAHGLALLRVSVETGSMELVPIGGSDVLEGTMGWLVEEASGLVALVSRQVGPDFGERVFERVTLATGAREVLVDELALDGRYFQPTHDRWIATVDWSPLCFTTVFGVRAEPWVFQSFPHDLSWCPTRAEYEETRGRRSLGWEGPHTPFPRAAAYTGHAQYPFAETAIIASETEAGGLGLIMFDEEGELTYSPGLEPPLLSYTSHPGSAAFSRFGRTLEVPTWDRDEHHRPLGWLEWALTADDRR